MILIRRRTRPHSTTVYSPGDVTTSHNVLLLIRGDVPRQTTKKYSLGDVPDHAIVRQSKKAVLDGDLVEGGALFIAEERIGDPDLIPLVLRHADLFQLLVDLPEVETRIMPLLT